MAKTYQQIQEQIAQLTRQAELARKEEIAGVVSRIKEAIAVYGLTAADLGFAGGRKSKKVEAPAPKAAKAGKRKGSTAGRKVAVKYRDDAGNTWTGRGNQPRWLKAALSSGKSIDDFRI
jgi:DNA-binding protein H-NS